jgi:hypothetical protein
VWDAEAWLDGALYDEDGTCMSQTDIAALTDERIGLLAEQLSTEAKGQDQVVCELVEAIESMRADAREEVDD